METHVLTPTADPAYLERRARIEEYFDRTAADTWARLTSDAPVGRVRATVREGRNVMRHTLMTWLPWDLRGMRVLDAGCGTGTLALEAARRGAEVVAVDLSRTLVELGSGRAAHTEVPGSVEFVVGDMLDPGLGFFDYLVSMDSLIHYPVQHLIGALRRMSPRISRGMLLTFAPRTPLLAAMHTLGKLFPSGHRSPAIEPIAEAVLRREIQEDGVLHAWRWRRTRRVQRGFYTSQAVELKCVR
jgi:magnesium-protoporphyrin O-methyltransferase